MLDVRRFWSVLLLSFIVGCDGSQPLSPVIEAASIGAAGSMLKAPSRTNADVASDSRIDVSWQDNSSNETGFEVHRSTSGPTGTFILSASTVANSTSYSDIGLSASTRYCYRVRTLRAYDGTARYSDFSPPACATTPATPTPPAPVPPSGVGATPASSDAVRLIWTDNSTTEDGFRVELSVDAGSTWTNALTVGPDITYAFDHGRTAEQLVCYRVIAFKGVSDAPPSNTDCATPPAYPTNLTANWDTTTGEVALAWTDNSAVEDGYLVSIWYVDQEGWITVQEIRLPANSTQTIAPGFDPYYYIEATYYVMATKDGGYSSSPATTLPH